MRERGVRRLHRSARRPRDAVLLHAGGTADGRSIETVESLGRLNSLSPLQRAFWEKHGLQCGYCTPGMLMLMTELLRENPEPDRDAIRARSTTISAAAPVMRTSSIRRARGRADALRVHEP